MVLHAAVLPLLLLVLAGTASVAAAQPYVDTVTFIRVGDAEEAVEAVRNGTLDIYYQNVPSSLVADAEGLNVYEVPVGGTLGLLLNPAEGDKFNPFQLNQIRFAVNYMVDREGIIEDLLGGYGAPMTSVYAPHDPDFIRTLEQTESFAIRYDPDLARTIIHKTMTATGAVMEDGVWILDGVPVEIKAFIRNDDPIRLQIGDTLASDLEAAGFAVERSYGDLAMAYQAVYGSNPGDLGWHLYTEGWGGGFSLYDDSSLAAFYAPWVANMPGHNNPEFWNYEHEELDRITQIIYNGDYTDGEHRTTLVRQALALGMQEAVRLFLVATADTYVAGEDVNGVINHVGGGISHSLTLTNVQVPSDELTVGVRLLSQSSWNVVAGLSDVYSLDIVGPLGLPSSVGHPHTGDTIPVAVQREAVTAGPDGMLDVPPDAIRWDPYEQRWVELGEGAMAVTAVSLNYTFGNWHHGQPVDMNDILYGVYFGHDWGTITGPDDKTQDSEYTATAMPGLERDVGVRQTGPDSMDVYINYWHFDQSSLASSGLAWLSIPWEIHFATERIVVDDLAKFSDTDAQASGVPWLSLIDPDDTALIREYLASFLEEGVVPKPLEGMDPEYYEDRYRAAIDWIDKYGHAYIGTGPFMLESHDEEAGTAVLKAFRDESYPLPKGVWSSFEGPTFPAVVGVSARVLEAGEPYSFNVYTSSASTLLYFLNHETGAQVYAGELAATGSDTITIPAEFTDVDACSLNLRIFALSDTVIIPDSQKTRVSVADCGISLAERLEEMGVHEDIEFLKTLAGVMVAAQQDNGSSVEDVMRIVDEQELSDVAIVLLSLILDDMVEGDEIFEYIRP